MTLFKTKLLGALKSKTMWFSGALAILAALLDNITYIQGFMSPHDYNILFIGVSLVVAGLRWITTNALEDKHVEKDVMDPVVTPMPAVLPPIVLAPKEEPKPKGSKPKAKTKPKTAAKPAVHKQPVAKWKVKKVKDALPK